MKQYLLQFVLIISIVSGGLLFSAFGEDELPHCQQAAFKRTCNNRLDGYTFSKSKVIEINSKKDERNAIFTIILSKGNEYVFAACDGGDDDAQMVVELLDRHDQKILSNYLESSGKLFGKIAFKCRASGQYNLRFHYMNKSGKGCGVCAVGFKKY